MNTKEMVSELMNLLAKRDELNNKIDGLRDKICAAIHPYKEGQEVVVKGYSHGGKKSVVSDVGLRINKKWREEGYDFSLYVKTEVLKKDGTISNYTANWSDDYDDNMRKAVDAITPTPNQ